MKTICFHQRVIRSLTVVILFCLTATYSADVVALGKSGSSVLHETISDRSAGFSIQDDAFLDELTKDTWTYLKSDWATTNHLPWSWRSKSYKRWRLCQCDRDWLLCAFLDRRL